MDAVVAAVQAAEASGPNFPLRGLDGDARWLAVGMSFVWWLTRARSVSLTKRDLRWLTDYGQALCALDATIEDLTLGELLDITGLHIDAFVSVASVRCPELLAACAEARAAS